MTSRRLATALATCVLPLALAACGSGRSPHTYEERPTVDAAQASLGDLELRNVTIAAPTPGQDELSVGGEARATMTVVNTGASADQLTGVSSPAATSAELVGPDGVATPSVAVPMGAAVGRDQFTMVLRGLTRAVRPGEHVEITVTFAQGGRRTLDVPVATYVVPEPRTSENPFEEHEGGAEG